MKRFAMLAMMFTVGLITLAQADGPVRRAIRGTPQYQVEQTINPSVCTGPECGQQGVPISAIPKTMAPSGKVAASLRSDLFAEFVQIKLAAELRKKGKSFTEAHMISRSVSPAMIHATADIVKVPMSVIGDGSILQAILDFFASPLGQTLLNALVQALLSMLGI